MKAPYFLPLRSNCWPFFSIVLLRRGRQAFRIRTVILLLCHNLPLNSLRINKAKQLCVRSGRETAMHRSSHIWPYFMYNADFRRRTNGTWTGDTNNKVLFTANYCVQAGDEERNASRKRIEFISVDFGMAKRCPHIPLFCERNKKILSICLHQRLKGFTKIKTNCTFTISYQTMLGDGFFFRSVVGKWLWLFVVVASANLVRGDMRWQSTGFEIYDHSTLVMVHTEHLSTGGKVVWPWRWHLMGDCFLFVLCFFFFSFFVWLWFFLALHVFDGVWCACSGNWLSIVRKNPQFRFQLIIICHWARTNSSGRATDVCFALVHRVEYAPLLATMKRRSPSGK